MYTGVLQFTQQLVKLEHSGAAMDNASDLLTVVMGLESALMAVMRLDVVSYNSISMFTLAVVLRT